MDAQKGRLRDRFSMYGGFHPRNRRDSIPHPILWKFFYMNKD